MRSIADGATVIGSVTTVERVADTVRRPASYWTPAVHALLRHLEGVGFSRAPRVLGFDENGREVLTYLHGEAAFRPWPPALLGERGIVTLANWLREYHEAVEGFVPPADAQWMTPGLVWQQGQIVRHGDLGPWNSVWQGDSLVGFIDWDNAEPGYPMQDVAQLAWYVTGPVGPRRNRDYGFDSIPDLPHRFVLICDTFGMAVSDVAEVFVELHTEDLRRIDQFSAQGLEPWLTWKKQHREELAEEVAWLKKNKDWFEGEAAV